MADLLKAYRDVQAEIEKALKYRFRDKEQQRSNRAHQLAEVNRGTRRICPMRHDSIAWSGPPHDTIRTYICLRCNAAASEPEIKSLGFDFDTVPDWIIYQVLDADLQRQAKNAVTFGGFGGLDAVDFNDKR